jgi:hypothetical protein
MMTVVGAQTVSNDIKTGAYMGIKNFC